MSEPQRSPYDILGITPESGSAEVHAAYEQLLATMDDPDERAEVTRAYDGLRSPARRVRTDLLEYAAPDDASTAREAFAGVAEEPLPRPAAPEPPPVAALLPLRRSRTGEDHRDPPPTQGAFAIPTRFSATADVLPPLDVPE